jgi:PleD family two-component response regulator
MVNVNRYAECTTVNERLTIQAQDSGRGERKGQRMNAKDRILMTQCLLIAADAGDRDQLMRLFKPYGFELSVVENAHDAMLLARRRLPEIVVMPDTLEGADSYDFIQRLCRAPNHRAAKVLVYSERADAAAIGRAIWGGASECFVKPFDAGIINLKLRQVGAL